MYSIIEDMFFSNATTWRVPLIESEQAISPQSRTRYEDTCAFKLVMDEIERGCTPQELDVLALRFPNVQVLGGFGLETAIVSKNLPVVQHILDIHPEFVNGGGTIFWKAPYVAIATNNRATFQEFIARGADIHLASGQGITALYAVTIEKTPDIFILKYLLDNKAVIYRSVLNPYSQRKSQIERIREQIFGYKRNEDISIPALL